ncbi:conserved Plasmodium protein, unknown function [Plasmodium malariae]|nr:conserved Plasmodium protein, unknown function [Plasmodium malariae]
MNEAADLYQKRKLFIEEIDEIKKLIEEESKSSKLNYTTINGAYEQRILNTTPLLIERSNLLKGEKIKLQNIVFSNNKNNDEVHDFLPNFKLFRKSNTDHFQNRNNISTPFYPASNTAPDKGEFSRFMSHVERTHNRC